MTTLIEAPHRGAITDHPSPDIGGETRRDPPDTLDSLVHALEARWTLSLSPASLILASLDWALHLSNAPGHQLELLEAAILQLGRLSDYAWHRSIDPATPPVIEAEPNDHRFRDPAWREPPFDLLCQSFLLTEEWWRQATTGIQGVSRHHERIVSFTARQLLDMVAPTNFPATNPEVIEATRTSGGENLAIGFQHCLEDLARLLGGNAETEALVVGRDLAATPGDVILRNELIELIRYRPVTAEIHPEPILIVPAWIMKYYILDLSPNDSLIRFLVGKGHQVYTISWRNPGREMAEFGMEDYRRRGVMAALEAIERDRPGVKVQACGYCLGGTLLTIAAAAMARDGDDRLASLTLLAAQTDFTEAGELQLFVDESQLSWLEDVMRDRGFLDARQMAGAFQMLRSTDLVWSRLISEYLLGRRIAKSDLMVWNEDATRMPAQMHAEYLRRFFLENDLAEGRYPADGRPVLLGNIKRPSFVVGTETDHVAPWRSVYKYLHLTDNDVTFALTNRGHNAGIVCPPGSPGRHYRLIERRETALRPDAESFLSATSPVDGSWWAAWAEWLAARAGPMIPVPAPILPSIDPAPGHYVFER